MNSKFDHVWQTADATSSTGYDRYLMTAKEFLAQYDVDREPIWGDSDTTVWASGEPLLINGPVGAGKSTIAQRLILSMIGVDNSEFMGLPVKQVTPDEFVLYLAADRPRQIRKSLRRMVNEDHREALKDHLMIRSGPPPVLVTQDPSSYVQMIEMAEQQSGRRCAALVVDSLKDMAADLASDEAGNTLNRGHQLVVQRETELLVLHHPRKATAHNARPKSLSDVYGSVWITAGSGTVLLAWPDSKADQDTYDIELSLLKESNAPWCVTATHDRTAGTIKLASTLSWPRYVSIADEVTVKSIQLAMDISVSTAKRRFNELRADSATWTHTPAQNTAQGKTEATLKRRVER